MAETEDKPVQEEEKQASNPIAKAESILQAITEQNNRMENNIKTLQEMKATDLLSGSAAAGHEVRPKTQDELDAEQAKRYLEGSGYEDIELN